MTDIVVSRGMARARVILVVVGVLGLVLGAAVLLSKQGPAAILGLAVWIVVAILLHDAVLSPVVVVIGVIARRAGRRVSRGVLLIVQGGVVVGAILTLLVVPEIYAKTLGSANDTVLPSDYAVRLGLMWLGMLVLVTLVSLLYLRLSPKISYRRYTSRRRPSDR